MREMLRPYYQQDSARALYISSFRNCSVSCGPHSQRHIENHRCCGKSVGLHRFGKQQVASAAIEKKWIVESALRLLRYQSRETARSRMESLTLCLEVPNNGLAIDGEKLCSLALFIRQRSCFLKIKIKAILAKIVTVMVFFVKVGLTLAGYYDFSANISFTFQAFKNLYVHPTYLWFGSFCKFLGNFYIYLEINSFSQRIG